MPELPEVETVGRALHRRLAGRRIGRILPLVARLRTPLVPARLRKAEGRRVLGVRRRGKSLVVELEGDCALLVHLGMSGSFRDARPEEPVRPHDRVRILLDPGAEVRFYDPRRFGRLELVELPAAGADPDELAGLGPEPLDRGWTGAALRIALRGRRTAIKPTLLDQRIVAGIGNIYASEALFRARLDPRLPAGRLGPRACARLVSAVRAVLREAIRRGGTTLRDHRRLDGTTGAFALRLRVYGRDGEPCRVCGATVRRFVQAGRSTYHCAACQRGAGRG